MPIALEHRIYFANGTTALYASLVSLGIKRSFIAVQPNVCPSVIVAIFASSNRPYFVDIEPVRLGISAECLDSAINKVSAIVAVHAYGIPCAIDKLAALAKKNGIPLIEDCAQAEGASYNGKLVGGFGDVAIFSYGAGKILALDGGGGMALTSRRDLANRLHDIQDRLPQSAPMEAAEELSRFFKFLYNQCYPDRLMLYRGAVSRFFRMAGRSILAGPRVGLAREIQLAQSGLSVKINLRRRNAKIYAEKVSGERAIQVCPLPDGTVPWRFNLKLEHSLRQHVLKTLLSEGLKVSSWYPDMRRFLARGSYASDVTPRAIELDETILNLWVDDDTTTNEIRITIRHLKQAIRDYCKKAN